MTNYEWFRSATHVEIAGILARGFDCLSCDNIYDSEYNWVECDGEHSHALCATHIAKKTPTLAYLQKLSARNLALAVSEIDCCGICGNTCAARDINECVKQVEMILNTDMSESDIRDEKYYEYLKFMEEQQK
jgi:hypothetical protein